MSTGGDAAPAPGGRLEVTPGPGAVLRFGAVAVWVGPTASAALVAYLTREARALGASPGGGRVLADQIATVLRAGDPEPAAPFVIVGAGEGGWGALLHGPVQLWDGAMWSTPAPGAGWLGVLLGEPARITVGPSGSTVSPGSTGSPFNLERGVVPGGGFAFSPEATTTQAAATTEAATAAATDASPSAPHATTDASAAPIPATPTPRGHQPGPADLGAVAVVDLRQAPARSRGPLRPVAQLEPAPPDAVMVSGVNCPRGHFNHPAAMVCLRCRTAIGDSARALISGPRPSLGVLIRDDGALFGLNSGYLLGADPGASSAAGAGGARPLTLAGDGIAPAHAELSVAGWELRVADRGSTGGTFVLGPGESQWSRLEPYQVRALTPGTHLACGQRIVTYASPWPG